MALLLLLFFLLVVVVAAPLGWAMFKVSQLRLEDARAEIVSPDDVEGDVLARLEKMVEPLVESGFSYQGMRAEQREGGSYWQAILSSAGGMVWALVEEPELGTLGRQVSFVSFSEQGSVIVTHDGDPQFGPEEKSRIFQEGPFESALSQAEAHAGVIQAEEIALQEVSGENFLKWLARRSRRKLDYMFESEWLQETPNEQLKVPLAKLPIAGVGFLSQAWQQKKRVKFGQSWLLSANLLAEATIPEPEPEPIAEEPLPELVAEPIPALVPAAAEPVIEPLPAVAEEVLEPELATDPLEQVAEEVHDDLPSEDGLERDLALYQRQASQRCWAYWFRGFGARGFFFVGVVAFVGWLAFSRGWENHLLLYAFVALVIHEGGHALAMLIRRSWDWSQFLTPLPHPMSAKSWPMGGGFGELATTLAGPLPGFIFGWGFLTYSFSGGQVNDPLLDFALVCALVNSFTLLPVLPLDGGRLLDLAMLRSAPRLRTLGLVLSGLIALVLAFLGGGVLLGILAVLLWSGIPTARRKSALLPWMQANVKDESLSSSEAGLAILREKGKEGLFKGAGGASKLDELTGLGRGKPLRALGCALALAILFFAWVGPLAFPAYEVGMKAKSWTNQRDKAEALANQYWPLAAPAEIDPAQREALGRLESLLSAGTPEEVFAASENVELVRFSVDGKALGSWADEDLVKRFPVVTESVKALRREAMKSADNGDSSAAFRDLSYAFRILTAWEPSHELRPWVSWMELEREVLEELEDISSRYQLPDSKVKWFEDGLKRFRQPTGPKIAALILRERKDLEALLLEDPKELFSGISFEVMEEAGLPAGQAFLQTLRRPAELLPAEPSQQNIAQANAILEASTSARNWVQLGEMIAASDSLKKSFSRIEANRSFREIALSGLRIKRLGPEGAQPELAKLRSEFGFQSRVVKEGERESLKLSRLTDTGERIEMEWKLKQ